VDTSTLGTPQRLPHHAFDVYRRTPTARLRSRSMKTQRGNRFTKGSGVSASRTSISTRSIRTTMNRRH